MVSVENNLHGKISRRTKPLIKKRIDHVVANSQWPWFESQFRALRKWNIEVFGFSNTKIKGLEDELDNL